MGGMGRKGKGMIDLYFYCITIISPLGPSMRKFFHGGLDDGLII